MGSSWFHCGDPFGPFLTHSGVYGHFYALFGPPCGGHQRCVQAQVRWGTYKKIWSHFESIFGSFLTLHGTVSVILYEPFWWKVFETLMVRLESFWIAFAVAWGEGHFGLSSNFVDAFLHELLEHLGTILRLSWGQLGAFLESVLGLFGKFLGPLGP